MCDWADTGWWGLAATLGQLSPQQTWRPSKCFPDSKFHYTSAQQKIPLPSCDISNEIPRYSFLSLLFSGGLCQKIYLTTATEPIFRETAGRQMEYNNYSLLWPLLINIKIDRIYLQWLLLGVTVTLTILPTSKNVTITVFNCTDFSQKAAAATDEKGENVQKVGCDEEANWPGKRARALRLFRFRD